MLRDSPIFLWPGRETGTTAQDASANNNDGTHACTRVDGPGGEVQYALSPTDASDVIASSVTTSYTTFTVACIFKWAGHTTMEEYVLASKNKYYADVHADFPFAMAVSTGGTLTSKFSVGNDYTHDLTLTGSSVGTTAWHMAHTTYTQGGQSVLYMDGAEAASASSVTISTTSYGWSFGRHAVQFGAGTDKSAFLNGSLAFMALYNTALSASVIAAHYNTWKFWSYSNSPMVMG